MPPPLPAAAAAILNPKFLLTATHFSASSSSSSISSSGSSHHFAGSGSGGRNPCFCGGITGIGIGTDILHLPRLYSLLFGERWKGKLWKRDGSGDSADRRIVRFAKRILSGGEMRGFLERFGGGAGGLLDAVGVGVGVGVRDEERKRREWELVRWLGVRWSSKEALYKAYPHPHPRFSTPHLHRRHHPHHQQPNPLPPPPPPLTWKDITLSYHPSGQPYLQISRILRLLRQPQTVYRRHDWVDFTGSFSHLPTLPNKPAGLEGKREEEKEGGKVGGGKAGMGGKEYEEVEVKEEALLTISHDGEYVVAFVMYFPQMGLGGRM